MPGRAEADIHQNTDGSISISYKPQEKGVHELSLLCNEQPVDGKQELLKINFPEQNLTH